MGDSEWEIEPPDILYETCACVIHLQLHFHYNDTDDSFRDSVQTTSYWVPEDQGTGVMMSQYMKLVLVSFTLIYSARCAFNSIVILMFARGVLREALVLSMSSSFIIIIIIPHPFHAQLSRPHT